MKSKRFVFSKKKFINLLVSLDDLDDPVLSKKQLEKKLKLVKKSIKVLAKSPKKNS